MPASALERRFLIACVPSRDVSSFLRHIQLRGVLLEESGGLRETVMPASTPEHSTVMGWVRSSTPLLEWLRTNPLVRSCSARPSFGA